MIYDYTIITPPQNFYIAEGMCRELRKAGKECFLHLINPKDMKERYPLHKVVNSKCVILTPGEAEFSDQDFFALTQIMGLTERPFIMLTSEEGVPEGFDWDPSLNFDASNGLRPFIMDSIKGVALPEIEETSIDYFGQSFIGEKKDDKGYFWVVQRCTFPPLNEAIIDPENPSITLQRAMRYLKGEGVPADEKRAFDLFLKAAAETPDNPWPHYYLGLCYILQGDAEKLVQELEKAIEMGHTPSMVLLGLYICDAMPQRVAYAKTLFQRAFDAQDVNGAYGLGLVAEREKDYAEAVEQYSIAAEMGNPLAQNNLGCMYFTGTGVDQNYDAARQWFQMGAQGMCPEAGLNLIPILRMERVDGDREQAAQLLELYTKEGYLPAVCLSLYDQIREARNQPQTRKVEEEEEDSGILKGVFNFFTSPEMKELGSYAMNSFFGEYKDRINRI